MPFLDEDGLTHFWSQIVAKFNSLKFSKNIEDSEGVSSLRQSLDTKYSGIAIVSKNPNAAALDSTLTDNEPIGATGDWAASLGGASSAQGKRSVAEGTNTVAKGKYSHAEGDNSVTLGNDSHAEGISTVAFGDQSHSEGINTQAIGQGSHAEGDQTIAAGYAAHAGGILSQANGHASFVSGSRVIADHYAQAVVGKFNNNKADTLFEVGDGYDEGYRHNAFEAGSNFIGVGDVRVTSQELDKLHQTLVTSVAGKTGPDITLSHQDINMTDFRVTAGKRANSTLGSYATAEGINVIASADCSHAGGDQCEATGYGAFASGILNKATTPGSAAFGSRTTANNYAQTTVGKWNNNKTDTLFEVGCGSEGARRNAFEVGDVNGNSFIRIGDIKLDETIATQIVNYDFTNSLGDDFFEPVYRKTVYRWDGSTSGKLMISELDGNSTYYRISSIPLNPQDCANGLKVTYTEMDSGQGPYDSTITFTINDFTSDGFLYTGWGCPLVIVPYDGYIPASSNLVFGSDGLRAGVYFCKYYRDASNNRTTKSILATSGQADMCVSVYRGGTGQSGLEDIEYTKTRYRASALFSYTCNPTVNGTICWQYE